MDRRSALLIVLPACLMAASCGDGGGSRSVVPSSVREAGTPAAARGAARQYADDLRVLGEGRDGPFGRAALSGSWSGISQKGQVVASFMPDGSFRFRLHDRSGVVLMEERGRFSVAADGPGSVVSGSGGRIGEWSGRIRSPGSISAKLGGMGDVELARMN